MKKKRFPTSITLLGRKYKIKQGNNLVYNNQPCLGLCDNINRTIFLEKDQDEQTKKEPLLHEAVHALLFITGIDQRLSESENEIYSQLFTAFYHDVEKALS